VGGIVLVVDDDVALARSVVVVADRFGPDAPHAADASRSATTTMRCAPDLNTGTYATDRMPSRLYARSALLVAAVALAGCGGSPHRASTSTASSRAPGTTAGSTTTTVPPTTTAPTTVAPTTPSTAPPTSAPAAPLLVTRLNGVGNAGQVIAVAASGYGATTATFTAYQRTVNGWQQVFGPWLARVGRRGFAPPGAKREGDGRTPSGSFGLSFFFGVRANPGVKFEYRVVGGSWIVWDDDSSSANYNRWIDTRSASAGTSPEPMYVPGVYDYGAVIAYNTQRAPGLGSAIFLHVSGGGTTAGCVSLPTAQLVSVLRWLDPARAPRIVMGTTDSITT
jgi:L,D-peptidoglycan transpeptidase YkuD (ErfK/YbiS/YcfS/YnhG family)